MRLLIIREKDCDLTAVLESCNIEVIKMRPEEALHEDMANFDAFCILLPEMAMDARLRTKIERENAAGKRVFTESIISYLDVYSAKGVNTVHSRLIYLEPESGSGIPGLETGDLLDDGSNIMMNPWFSMKDTELLLVYQEYIIAHTHTNMSREEILKDSKPGLWKCCGDTVMMTSFQLHNFNKARFSPRTAWVNLIIYIAEWLTGNKPAYMPESVVKYGISDNLPEQETFDKCRKQAIEKGVQWLKQFLVDNGHGGIREGLRHDIDPNGNQKIAFSVRTDCTGEASGVFKMYGHLEGKEEYTEIGENLERFVYGPMMVKDGLFNGMMRWTDEGWGICYQDDVARAILPTLYDCVFRGKDQYFQEICQVLDFLIKTTAKDGTRVYRTENLYLDENAMASLSAKEVGLRSAHYNSYYSAALLLAYKYSGELRYLEVGKRGLESIMSLYPETKREQSETQEMCRLILPLAILYDVTGEKAHREMLYRVANDLQKIKHPFGGYQEWDTGYKAACSRESTGECSLLTENGDPVTDSLYSMNWLPIGFAYAYYATGDIFFYDLWKENIKFFLNTQISSENPVNDGSWCRAFDMNLQEVYGAPHDCGWGPYCSETGWTCAEILMGMMFLDIVKMK